MARKDDIVEMQRRGLSFHFTKNKIELINGEGRLISSDTISVKTADGKDTKVSAKNIIIATGSSANNVPPFDLSEEGVMDNRGSPFTEETAQIPSYCRRRCSRMRVCQYICIIWDQGHHCRASSKDTYY